MSKIASPFLDPTKSNFEPFIELEKSIMKEICYSDQENIFPSLSKEAAQCSAQFQDDSQLDVHAEKDLKEKQVINWCRTIHRLYPLKVQGEGNLFLESVSLFIWGDTRIASLLRRLVFVAISEGAEKFLKRWESQKNLSCHNSDEEYYKQQWHLVVKAAGKTMNARENFGFPHPIHVFVLANVLRRPIVIVPDSNSFPISGLYLPILWDSSECIHWPIMLVCHGGQFIPLVSRTIQDSSEQKIFAENAIPLVTVQLEVIRTHFLFESEERIAHELLQKFLMVTEINLTRSEDICMVLSARLKQVNFSLHVCNESMNLEPSNESFHNFSTASNEWMTSLEYNPEVCYSVVPCLTNGCKMFGIQENGWKCTRCYLLHGPALSSSTETILLPSAPGASIITLNDIQRRPYSESEETSLIPEKCIFLGCQNMMSRYTHPYCYDHVESVQHSAIEAQHSRSPDQLFAKLLNNQPQIGHTNEATIKETPPVTLEIDKQFVETMKELETRTKISAANCKRPGCTNFGNGRCQGYCHGCFQTISG